MVNSRWFRSDSEHRFISEWILWKCFVRIMHNWIIVIAFPVSCCPSAKIINDRLVIKIWLNKGFSNFTNSFEIFYFGRNNSLEHLEKKNVWMLVILAFYQSNFPRRTINSLNKRSPISLRMVCSLRDIAN